MNYLLTIEYEGTRYEGWQRQKKSTQTIQGKLEQVLSRMTEKEIEIDGAGRTDAGVHAKNQTASVHLAKKWDPKEILQYMNQYLPENRCDHVIRGDKRDSYKTDRKIPHRSFYRFRRCGHHTHDWLHQNQ